MDSYLKGAKLGDNPILKEREPDFPVGLKVSISSRSQYPRLIDIQNLGATCYANASLQVSHTLRSEMFVSLRPFQVWFRDLRFRSGVYTCKPSEEAEEKFKVVLPFTFSWSKRTL
jgi:hypothetical protein